MYPETNFFNLSEKSKFNMKYLQQMAYRNCVKHLARYLLFSQSWLFFLILIYNSLSYSSTAQIFPTGVFSTQLENDEKECLLSVIDITPDGKIVVLDSNNATLKIYDSAFQYQSSFKFLITKENCVSRYGIEAMAMLSNEEVMVCVFDESMGTKFHILDISEDKPYIKSTAYAQDIEVKAMTSCQNKIFIAGVYSQKHKLPFVNQIDQHGTMIWNTDLKEDRGHPTKIHMCCMVRNDHLSVLVVESQHASKIRNYDGATGKLIFEVLIADRGDIACITFGNDCIYVCFPHAETIDVYNSGFGLFKTVKFGGDPPLYMKYCELHALLFVSNTGAYPHVIDKMNILELKGHTYY